MHLRCGNSNAGFTRVTADRTRSLRTAAPGTLLHLWIMGNTLMAQINLGKGGQVQYHSGNRSTTNHTPSERRSVFHETCDGIRRCDKPGRTDCLARYDHIYPLRNRNSHIETITSNIARKTRHRTNLCHNKSNKGNFTPTEVPNRQRHTCTNQKHGEPKALSLFCLLPQQ